MSNTMNEPEVTSIVVGGTKMFTAQNQSSGTDATTTQGQAHGMLSSLWQKQLAEVHSNSNASFKLQELPLARIKKIMKMDEEVKMISAEAPLLFAKAAHMFITELSLRAWVHTEESKRRTLQRNDIATAITKYDQFDFLIDIVPREELKPSRTTETTHGSSNGSMQYFYTIPQQPTSPPMQVRTTSGAQVTGTAIPGSAIVLTQAGGQLVQLGTASQLVSQESGQQQQQQQVVQVNQSPQQTTSITPDCLQQVIANSGLSAHEIQQIQITRDGQIQIVKNAPGSSVNQNQSSEESNSGQVSSDPSVDNQILRLSSALQSDKPASMMEIYRKHPSSSNNNNASN